ncbi:hypothetical protein [Spirosoma sp.]|uniref:hypothetical protein n=1 Tax=Spirosoma sp. TaxID=1899569 RepID=UPI002615DC81|nr:hypothetical protein [Spirosoma sp.]MCX6218310.1 hypothetical protein [Spirosoma sp.]
MQTLTAPQTLTIADLDNEWDFSPLDEAIEEARPNKCRTVEFIDDNHKRGYRALEYKVEVVAGIEYDEEGWASKYEKYLVSIRITPTMPLHTIVHELVGEINALIES